MPCVVGFYPNFFFEVLSLLPVEHFLPFPSATADADVSVQPPGDRLPVQVQRVEGRHPGAGAVRFRERLGGRV